MAENQEQPVVDDAEVQAKPEAEVQNAQTEAPDELDKLLQQYAEESKPEATTQPEQTGDANDHLLQRIDALESDLTRFKSGADMQDTIKAIRGELDEEVFDDDLIEGWLDKQAQKDPRLTRAWANRHNDPKAFDKVKASLGQAFSQKFANMPNKEATEDREAVAAAVRGTSTKTPEGKAPDYSGDSDQSFAEKVEKQFGFRPI